MLLAISSDPFFGMLLTSLQYVRVQHPAEEPIADECVTLTWRSLVRGNILK